MRYKEEFRLLLDGLEKRRQKANEEYAKCPPGALVREIRGGKTILFDLVKENGTRKRRVITDDSEAINALARKKYLETELDVLNKDIAALNKLISEYTDTSVDTIIEKLPERYKELPRESFFRSNDMTSSSNRHHWASQPYQQSTFEPEEKIQMTSRGLKVRTKSEVIVAEKLDEADIAYRYEQMIYIEGFSFAPDFTIMTKDGIKYWEHAGKVNDKGYLRRHRWKMEMYERAGIVPWKNLIVTYDDPKGGLDSRIIVSEIRNKLL